MKELKGERGELLNWTCFLYKRVKIERILKRDELTIQFHGGDDAIHSARLLSVHLQRFFFFWKVVFHEK
jgi:hypothetical protein